jgi:hypothetical protein
MSTADASKKILGFKYQEMVALLACLNAKDTSKIYLESFGDISNDTTSIEVKHSVDSSKKLINTHIDFWKTIYNILNDYDEFRFYSKFILHTTAKIKDDSVFENWDKQTIQERKDNVLSIIPNDTIKPYFETVKNCKAAELKDILGKFEIHSEQPSAKDFYREQLLKHPAITNPVAAKDAEAFIVSLFGYISIELIRDESYKWEIDIQSFKENFRSYLKAYQLENLVFPISKVSTDEIKNNSFRFVKELEEIEYDVKIGQAVRDYLRASESQYLMLEKRRSLANELDDFDDEILEEFEDKKLTHLNTLESDETTEPIKQSRKFYDNCMDEMKMKQTIIGVEGVKSYYPKGRLHNHIENNSELKWKLNTDNES